MIFPPQMANSLFLIELKADLLLPLVPCQPGFERPVALLEAFDDAGGAFLEQRLGLRRADRFAKHLLGQGKITLRIIRAMIEPRALLNRLAAFAAGTERFVRGSGSH